MLGSEQVGTLITALGAGIGREEFNIEKMRYHRIIIMTDADVDGAHIRTLLLTFFYRQMPEVIEKGYLYIAQPPLYKAERGKSERYLKDEAELDEYLIEQGVNGQTLILENGEQIAGADLRARVKEAAAFKGTLARLALRAPAHIVEQAALAGVLAPAPAMPKPKRGAERLNRIAEEGEDTWTRLVRRRRLPVRPHGARRRGEGRARSAAAGDAGRAPPCRARRGDRRSLCRPLHPAPREDRRRAGLRPCLAAAAVLEAGERGIKIQRYKGLGEMNPEQLWETTLDPNARTLLQVKVEHADTADEMFSKLMGDLVEPRREFIQENALEAEVDA